MAYTGCDVLFILHLMLTTSRGGHVFFDARVVMSSKATIFILFYT